MHLQNIPIIIFDTLFQPKRISENTKESFFIPLIIFFIYQLSPLNSLFLENIIFIMSLSYLSTGLRYAFENKFKYYSHISMVSPLIFGIINKYFLIISILWVFFIKIKFDISQKYYYSLLIGSIFDIFIVWWYL
ncbi:hypothetical protein OF820_11020 [Oceanotoga sp. DSM 15011]|jgi:hypothetical protein|uniref:Uncharacterized protein n=1 Tax=Oceanotoga teriensis TaxID=515440 RepID=A0AA45HHS5_9BACT|nr:MULTISPECIES: hypothetical protein [Oceanotoga]MDN5341337.1 hypothetical protein [Oceanotoga sp.]PWJ87398.1 hypothetical protein C7380_1249 [Oceanotoga teriensis]UYO99592.1 hypothetical protein OF820_11020 [Oceanotoga sp. DSM 15011]